MSNEEIVLQIKNGYSVTDNMQILYERNLPLIKMYIKKYSVYETMEDLLQEAYLGLWEAVQHYEETGNVLFMTYARFWIKQAVIRYIENCGSLIKVPSHFKQIIYRYKKILAEAEKNHLPLPTEEELAHLLKISLDRLDDVKAYSQTLSSLDANVTEQDMTLHDAVKDDFCLEEFVIDKMYDDYSKNELWGIVERYTDTRESDIIKSYFLYSMSMPQIAKEYGLTTERIRTIKNNGLRRLKIGKAKRELIEKFEIMDASLYRSGYNKFKDYGESTVEYIAIRRMELEKEYAKKRIVLNVSKERECV